MRRPLSLVGDSRVYRCKEVAENRIKFCFLVVVVVVKCKLCFVLFNPNSPFPQQQQCAAA